LGLPNAQLTADISHTISSFYQQENLTKTNATIKKNSKTEKICYVPLAKKFDIHFFILFTKYLVSNYMFLGLKNPKILLKVEKNYKLQLLPK
jgi:hypothetical protein